MSNSPSNQDPFQGHPREIPFEDDLRAKRVLPVQPAGGEDLPYSVAVLVLGIVSIVGAFFYGIFGIAFSIVALALSSSSMRLYATNPPQYSHSSYGQLRAGRVCAIVGLILSALVIMAMVLLWTFFLIVFI